MARTQKADSEKNPPEPSFEDSLTELQQIVDELEEGALGLEDSMAHFEKGVSLLRACHAKLEQAEQRIEILTGQDADGNPVTAPFEATATMQNSPGKKRKGKSAANSKNSGSESETDNSTLF